jgi:hypothetical protein
VNVRALNKLMMRELEAGPHVVIVGDNPAQGFIVYGPFRTGRAALDFLHDIMDCNGWIQPLENPKDG